MPWEALATDDPGLNSLDSLGSLDSLDSQERSRLGIESSSAAADGSMKSSASRSQRGRPNKVTKQGPSPRSRAARQQLPASTVAAAAAAAAAAVSAVRLGGHDDHLAHPQAHDPHAQVHEHDPGHPHGHDHDHDHDLADHLKADPSSIFDSVPGMGAEDYAAAAAAAAAMDTDLTEDAHGEAEPEADMDQDDADDAAAAASGLPPHVDLTAAAILANGGAPGPVGVQEQLQEMQQSLAHAQHAAQQAHAQHQLVHQHQHQHQPAAQMGGADPAPHGLPTDPQQQQQQPPTERDGSPKMTDVLALESGYTDLNVESALAKRLAREVGRRLAQQRRPDQQLNLGRRSNVEALFAHIAGEPARLPCKNCHKGHGPWVSCIVVDGQMCGSCANCWFNASGARCSFHETRNPPPLPQHAALLPATTAALADPTGAYRFAVAGAPPLPLLHQQAAASAIPAAAAALRATASSSRSNGGSSSSPLLQQMVSRAMSEVRAADKATRQLIQIDVTARQLALQIAEYEEMIGGGQGGENVGGAGGQGMDEGGQ